MTNLHGVIPFIHTVNASEVIKKEIYFKYFDVKHLGNFKGSMPINGIDFNEDDTAYSKRLKAWKFAERGVFFEGWHVKDMKHWHLCENYQENISITFEFNAYTIVDQLKKKEYKFPTLPDTIDDFINDCRRIGIKLFWKQEIFDKFGLQTLDSYPDKDLNNILSQSLN